VLVAAAAVHLLAVLLINGVAVERARLSDVPASVQDKERREGREKNPAFERKSFLF